MSKYDSYNPDWAANYYDEYGDREWTRFARSPADEVSLFLHTHYLERFVEPGSRVLEVGAGPGRFTKIMAEMGCRVLVADISQVQLDLHRTACGGARLRGCGGGTFETGRLRYDMSIR